MNVIILGVNVRMADNKRERSRNGPEADDKKHGYDIGSGSDRKGYNDWAMCMKNEYMEYNENECPGCYICTIRLWSNSIMTIISFYIWTWFLYYVFIL